MAEEMLYVAEELGRLAEVFSIKKDKQENFIHFNEEDGAFEVLPTIFFAEGGGKIFGWDFGEPFAMYKEIDNNNVFIVVWKDLSEMIPRECKRIAERYRGDEKQAILQIGEEAKNNSSYEEYETVINKTEFYESPEEHFKDAKIWLARKIRKDLIAKIKMVLDGLNDKSILDFIPDHFIISFEDSLEAGNCVPGTEEFRDKYFPGKTEITAGELKEYADNRDVMRIFRYIYKGM